MSDETNPAQPSLATFLHGKPAPKPGTGAPAAADISDVPQGAGQAPAIEAELPLAAPPPDEQPVAHASTADAHVDRIAIAGDVDDMTPAAPAPSFTRSTRVTPVRVTPRWQWAVVAGLALLLGVQILIADRARLAADAGTRPLVSGLCAALGCTLPAWHEPSAYSMLSRDIRPAPGQPGVLQVHASFRNEARWAQAWPALRLSLSDADGRVIGRRSFQPAEYLGPGADPQARLEQGQSAQVSFQLREPAAATVAFSFEFQ